MKHHAFIKTIAIILCAASLLGMAASGLGMFVLTEQDLYHKTVDQVMSNEQRSWAESYAKNQALRYATVNLGGASLELREHFYGIYGNGGSFAPERYGFTLLDSEGNPLTGINGEMKEKATVYTVPVSGQYIHVVSETPMSERHPPQTEPPVVQAAPTVLEGEGLYDNLPEHGKWTAYSVSARYSGGEEEGMSSSQPIGELSRDENGRVIFTAWESSVLDNAGGAPLTYICFRDMNNKVLYEVSNDMGVGKAYYEPGDMLIFVSAVPGELNTARDSELADNTIGQVEFYSAEDPEAVSFTVYGDEGLGTVWYDEEGILRLSLRSIQDSDVRSSGTITGGEVSGLAVYNRDGIELLRYQNGGNVTIDSQTLEIRFQAHPQEAPAEEMVPEEQSEEESQEAERSEEEEQPEEETVPATIAETAPETTPETVPETTPETVAVTVSQETEPVMVGGRLLSDYEFNHIVYFSPQCGEDVYVEYVYTPLPEYTVEVYISQELQNGEMLSLLNALRSLKDSFLPILGICAVVFMLLSVYLCFAAGRGMEPGVPQAGGLNRLPLDLYFLGGGTVLAAIAGLCIEGFPYFLRQSLGMAFGITGGLAYLGCLTVVGFLFALVAQWKTPGYFVWHNSLCGRLFRLGWKGLKWGKGFLVSTCIPVALRLVKWAWKYVKRMVVGFCQWLDRIVGRAMDLLPMTWQWMVVLFLLMLFITVAVAAGSGLLMLLCMALAVALALYVSFCFGSLLESTKRMRQGELDHKVDGKRMVGCFYDFARELNQLADVAVVAAQKQLKSERMKSELITNVSHDIKTPLTSIINYVDLLQKPHSEEEEEIYLEVLERQSLSLKKLIEDLMDMSKASTGNMAVEPVVLDGIEAVNQALGEYADKLEKAMIVPVFRHSDAMALMVADGRLTWRVLGNLLNNAVKYAMPGTRLYIDLMVMEKQVVISLKNISRDELNVGAEELMERFVRGEDSRSTEGSGLGLNIAKSLMELQKGQLELLVDGDLFKVTLIFPAA